MRLSPFPCTYAASSVFSLPLYSISYSRQSGCPPSPVLTGIHASQVVSLPLYLLVSTPVRLSPFPVLTGIYASQVVSLPLYLCRQFGYLPSPVLTSIKSQSYCLTSPVLNMVSMPVRLSPFPCIYWLLTSIKSKSYCLTSPVLNIVSMPIRLSPFPCTYWYPRRSGCLPSPVLTGIHDSQVVSLSVYLLPSKPVRLSPFPCTLLVSTPVRLSPSPCTYWYPRQSGCLPAPVLTGIHASQVLFTSGSWSIAIDQCRVGQAIQRLRIGVYLVHMS